MFWLAALRTDGMVSLLAQVGAVILLFEVGLESTLHEMLRVGGRALLAAVLDDVIGLVILAVVGSVISAAPARPSPLVARRWCRERRCSFS